ELSTNTVLGLSYLIVASCEAMEQGLRDCCRSIRIGKILIQSDEETQRAKVYYAKFPPDIYRRKVLLMYPILSKCLSSPCTVRLIWTVSANFSSLRFNSGSRHGALDCHFTILDELFCLRALIKSTDSSA
uniref:Phosphoribosyltransferase domain-containing protein n=1 Tax=Accipiter nisus TaxID=211598 RepID=A0A8B9NJH0_9AVES